MNKELNHPNRKRRFGTSRFNRFTRHIGSNKYHFIAFLISTTQTQTFEYYLMCVCFRHLFPHGIFSFLNRSIASCCKTTVNKQETKTPLSPHLHVLIDVSDSIYTHAFKSTTTRMLEIREETEGLVRGKPKTPIGAEVSWHDEQKSDS